MPRSEMGQGVHTALAMLVAEELRVPLARVQLEPLNGDSRYGNVSAAVDSVLYFSPDDSEPGAETGTVRATRWLLAKAVRELGLIVTGGSSSVADSCTRCCAWPRPPHAPSCWARRRCAGSCRWPSCRPSTARCRHPSGQRATYAELAARGGGHAAGRRPADGTRAVAAAGHAGAAHRQPRQDRRPCALRHRRTPARPVVCRHRPGPHAGRRPRCGGHRRAAAPPRRAAPGAAAAAGWCRAGAGGGGPPQLAGAEGRARAVGRRRTLAAATRPAARRCPHPPPAGRRRRTRRGRRGRLRVPPPGRPRCRAAARRPRGRGALPRALAGARGDGTPQLHRAGGRRPRAAVGADPGAQLRAGGGRAGGRRRRECRRRARALPGRRLRPPAGSRRHGAGRARGAGDRRRAGAAAVVARGGPAPRLLPPGGCRAAARHARRPGPPAGPGGRAAPATPSCRAYLARGCPRWPRRSICPTRPPPRACSACPTACRSCVCAPGHAARGAGGLVAVGRAIRTTPSLPRASSTSWRMPPVPTPWPGGWRC
jgi:hypothetical protein